MNLQEIRAKSAHDIVRALEHEFFKLDRVHGSHHIYLRRNAIIAVPFSREADTLSPGVLQEICKVAGWRTRCDLVRAGLLAARGHREHARAKAMRAQLVAAYGDGIDL